MSFASDNTAPTHPNVIRAIAEANNGYAMPYGNDHYTQAAVQQIRDVFEAPEAEVFLVTTGSAANALALSSFAAPWQTIYCHRMAHIYTDECGAPEFYTGGAKLTLLDGQDAKFSPETLRAAIAATAQGDVHVVQRGPVSITNTTEFGAIYGPQEVAAISQVCRDYDLPLHMDGARFSNALVAAGCSPAEMTWKAGVDVLSFGGTKNGLIGVEAVVFFNTKPAWEFQLRRKRSGHLLSKNRFLAAQMNAYLADDLWLDMAKAANAAAASLERAILELPAASLAHPRQANAVFVNLPRKLHRAAQAGGAAYGIWPHDVSLDGDDDELLMARLMCSWCTTNTEIDQLVGLYLSA